jgi:hypothetical protein
MLSFPICPALNPTILTLSQYPSPGEAVTQPRLFGPASLSLEAPTPRNFRDISKQPALTTFQNAQETPPDLLHEAPKHTAPLLLLYIRCIPRRNQ